jgi:14-3-3 protein epsilon
MDRQDLVGRAKLAEHTEQYDVMIDCVKNLVANFNSDFTQEERTLLSVAYKQAVGERRNSWRVLNSYADKERSRNSDNVSLCESYKQRVYNELVNLCKEVIGLIETSLYKESDDVDSRVFYLKMKGDYYRYAAEAGDQESVEKGRESYNAANELAQELDAANPNKL